MMVESRLEVSVCMMMECHVLDVEIPCPCICWNLLIQLCWYEVGGLNVFVQMERFQRVGASALV